jgi:hypothetical protein
MMNSTIAQDIANAQDEAQVATQQGPYDEAKRRMQRAKRLVIAGFSVAVAGMIGYCAACLGAGVNQDFGVHLLERPQWLIAPTLGTVGLGTVLWLIGSFHYLSAAMDSDPDGPDLFA